MDDRATPETDAKAFLVIDDCECGIDVVRVALARKLERERNELREAVRKLRDAKGRHHSQIAAEELFKLIP